MSLSSSSPAGKCSVISESNVGSVVMNLSFCFGVPAAVTPSVVVGATAAVTSVVSSGVTSALPYAVLRISRASFTFA